MITASNLGWAGLLASMLVLVVPSAQAQMGRQAQLQQHQQNTMHYENWMQNQQSTAYINGAEVAAQNQLAANIAAAEHAKVRKDASRDWWATIVVSTESGSWNAQLNAASKEDAMRQAMEKCEGVCYPVLSLANSCVAPAYSGQGGMYFSPGEDKAKATAAALQACKTAGGKDCKSPPEQAFCNGWKYAYSPLDRFLRRVDFTAQGKIAEPQYLPFPGAAEFIAKPLERRGTTKAAEKPANSNPKASMAQAWTAIAGGSASKAYGIHLGLNERDASDTAIARCGQQDCKVIVAFTSGQCAAVVRFGKPDQPINSYGSVGKTVDEAREEAVMKCLDADEARCPVAFNHCM